MDNVIDDKDLRLLDKDKYTFAVLRRVWIDECMLKLTDHRNYIICHSEEPYPIWIWTEDGITDSVMDTVYRLVREHFPFDTEHRFNLKYRFAEYMMRRAHEDGYDFHIDTNLFAYDCPSPVAPLKPAEGHAHTCCDDDAEEAAEMHHSFFDEVGDITTTPAQSLERVRDHIKRKEFFFWKDDGNRTVACTDYIISDDLAYIGCVYTRPESRRHNYAQHLVYHVTKLVHNMGYMPMLYTDADYPASNACYEKIGYVNRGRLCTVCR